MKYIIHLKKEKERRKDLYYTKLLHCESIFCNLINYIGFNYQDLIIHTINK